MPANLRNSVVAIRLEKVSFHFNPKEEQCQRMFKPPYDCTHFTLAKLCSKFFKLNFSSIWTKNFQMYMLGLEMAKEPEIKFSTFLRSQRKPGNSRETPISASLTILKPLVCISQQTGKFTKRWEYQTAYLAPEKPVCRSRRNS